MWKPGVAVAGVDSLSENVSHSLRRDCAVMVVSRLKSSPGRPPEDLRYPDPWTSYCPGGVDTIVCLVAVTGFLGDKRRLSRGSGAGGGPLVARKIVAVSMRKRCSTRWSLGSQVSEK